ncbi:MAG: AbrB/MazE/SpoVT family DNA-binding domain-containing protein [Chloroflexota bacterium]|nr:AbrB/MazE/SpoVT family DNA-binding domain-containing protein [Chloroflexota bacterium]
MVREAQLIKIGNSQGIRLPKWMVSKYGFGKKILLEEVSDGILIRAIDSDKLSWEDTYKAMSEAQEAWSDWQDVDMELDAHL